MDYEVDKISIAKSGREFFGDDFSQSITSRTYVNKLDYRLASFPINYNFRFVNASSAAFTLSLAENSSTIFTKSLTGYGSAGYTLGVDHTENATFNGNLPDNRSALKFTIASFSVTSVGYLDILK